MSKKTKILPTREELEGAVRGGGRKLPLTTQLAILPFEDKREAYIKLVNKLQKAGHFKEVQALEKEHGIRSANFHQLAGAGIGGGGSTSGVFGDIFGDFIPFVPNNPAPKSDFGNIATGTTPKLRRNLERALPILAQLGDKYNIPIGNSKVRSVVEQLIPALPSIDSPLVKKPEATKPRIQDTTPETPEPKVADPETAQKASGRTKITETPIDSPPSALGGGTEGKESTGIEQKTAPSSDPSPDDPIPVPVDEPIPDVDKDSEPDKKEKRRRRPPIPFRDTDSEPDEEDDEDIEDKNDKYEKFHHDPVSTQFRPELSVGCSDQLRISQREALQNDLEWKLFDYEEENAAAGGRYNPLYLHAKRDDRMRGINGRPFPVRDPKQLALENGTIDRRVLQPMQRPMVDIYANHEGKEFQEEYAWQQFEVPYLESDRTNNIEQQMNDRRGDHPFRVNQRTDRYINRNRMVPVVPADSVYHGIIDGTDYANPPVTLTMREERERNAISSLIHQKKFGSKRPPLRDMYYQ